MASRPAASVRSSRGTPSEMRPGDTSFYTAACERDCGARERRSRCVPAVTEASTGSGGDVERERIVEAAVAEFAAKSFGGFSLEGVAHRAAVDVRTLKEMWASSPELLGAALRDFGQRHLPLPDTGSLRGDLLAYAGSFAAMLSSPIGRRLLDAVLIRSKDWELSDARPRFLEIRYNRISAILQRAIERGECNPDVEPVRIVDVIGLGVSLPIILYDRPITDADCTFIVDLVVDGVRPRR